jgi:hypothetical protein
MHSKAIARAVTCALLLSLAACGGGGSDTGTAQSSAGNSTPPPTGTVSLMVSDDSAEDWATIGVKVLSIALIPQGGGAAVTVYTAPTPAPMVNLEQLDQLSEILGNVSVPAGTYTGAALTLGGNAGDVVLMSSADPEPGFAAAAGAAIPSSQIQIQGGQGVAPNRTVALNVSFVSPLVVTAGQSNALDLEFNLDHPAFIVGHTPPAAGGTTLWAVNFKGPVRHHPIADITHRVLRHTYGTVASVAADNSSITITKDLPALPITNPETAVSTKQNLQILADSANGTLFFDVDAKTKSTIKDFSSVAASLAGKYVRIAARYQQNGTLVGVRIWASSTFNSVWLSPEGHVDHINAANTVMWVTNEQGVAVPLTVDANTQFFFRTPENGLADATPIGTGTAFLAANNLVRGFKVHVSVVDPLATPLVAQTVDIETAAYDGRISGADTTGERQGLRWQRDYGLQVVELRLPDPGRERRERYFGLRVRHERRSGFWRDRGPCDGMGPVECDLERPRQSERLVRSLGDSRAHAGSAWNSGDEPRQQRVHHDRSGRSNGGYSRREHHYRLSDIGLSD